MATSSRLCSDGELHKAKAPSPIPDDELEHDQEGTVVVGEKEKKCKDGKKKKKKKKKKTTYILPKEEVEIILNYQCRPFHGNDNIHKAAQEDEETYGDLRTLVTVAGVLTRNYHNDIRAAQEKLRHEIETKGYYAYEATDDEEDNDGELACQQGPRGQGGMLTKFLKFLKRVGTRGYKTACNLFKK